MTEVRSITINFHSDIPYQRATWIALASTEHKTGMTKENILMSYAVCEVLKFAMKKEKKGKKLNVNKVNLLKNRKIINMED